METVDESCSFNFFVVIVVIVVHLAVDQIIQETAQVSKLVFVVILLSPLKSKKVCKAASLV